MADFLRQKMRFSSIFYSITFIFGLASTAIFLAFLWLKEYDQQNYTRELNTKYSVVTNAMLMKLNGYITTNEYEEQVEGIAMPEIDNEILKEQIKTQAQIIEKIERDIGSGAILYYKKRYYLLLTTHTGEEHLLFDDTFQPYRYDIITLIFSLVFLILLMTYIFVIRKIKPLRKLKRQINKFASGDLNIANTSTGNDEISEVADAFYKAVRQIKVLNHSRTLFLRNIMHELKTPITKGRITAEMIPQDKYQERLIKVFERLEQLINEFAAIEQASAGFANIDASVMDLRSILDEAKQLAMCDDSLVMLICDENISIKADFRLLSVAFKNIIDNGIKYATDHKIQIIATQNKVSFLSRAQPLKHELSYYTQPFTQENKNPKNTQNFNENSAKHASQTPYKDGFGLGLYIVDNILKAHNFSLHYEYIDGKNVFYVLFDNNQVK